MPLSEKDLKHLWDMLAAARETASFVEGIAVEAYVADRMRQRATERGIEVVGEAARRVSAEGRASVPLEWSAIVATRHIMAHEYDTVDDRLVYRIATVHIPALILVLASILEANPPGPEALKDPAEP